MSIPGTIQFPALSTTPSPPPTSSYVLYVKSDNTLNLEDSFGNVYTFGATNAITALTGDVSAMGPGSVAATVNFVGGESAANVASATVAYLNATSTNTPTTLVLRDSSGNFSAGTITANLTGTATNATNAITAVNFSGSLVGDVTGTQGATVVSLVGGQTASAVAAATVIVDDATSSNTASTLVLRDASGNFSASTITANLTGTATNATNATNAVTSINFTGSLSGDVTGTQSATSISSTTVTGKLLTGYTAGVNTPIISTDSILIAFEKLQAQVSGTIGAAITSLTGDVSATGPGSAAATVTAIQGSSVSTTAPTDAQILIYNNIAAKYVPESFSGDVLVTNSGSTTIQPNVVSNSKLAQTPTDTLKGNNTGSTANVTDLTISQVNTMLGTVTTIGTYDSQTSQANGLDIIGNTLYAQSATITNPGMVNVTTQSFAGNKTFTGTVAISPSSTSALTIDTSSFVFDSVNNALGIGLQPATSVAIDLLNSSGSSKAIQQTSYGTASTNVYRGRFARGTVVSPSAAQSGDTLAVFSGRGYGSSQFASASTGVINIVAGETFTNSSNLTYLQFSTTPTGSVTSAESMRVASTGVTLGPQSSSIAVHQINGGLSGTTNTISSSTYTLDSVTTDYIVYTNSTSNAITLTLPAPTNGRILVIEDKSGTAGTNNVTVNPHASETINGKSSFVISQNYGSIRITSDGTNWFIQALAPNVASTIQPVIALTESGGATTINWATGNMFTLTLNANLTITFSNATAGQTIVIRLTNTASNYTVTWGTTVKWPVQTNPVQTVGAFSDVYTIIFDGTTYFGSYVQNF